MREDEPAAFVDAGAFADATVGPATAPAGGSGLDWSDPLATIHAAFVAAQPGDTVKIAQGTYTPDVGHPALPAGSRAASFVSTPAS